MKTSKPKMAAVIAAAVMSLGQAVQAEDHRKVTLLENLSPQDRAAIEDRLRILDQQTKIDWKNVITGVNENGEIVLIPRNSEKFFGVSQPSCWVME